MELSSLLAGVVVAMAVGNISGKQFNTVHANDFHFYEELNAARMKAI